MFFTPLAKTELTLHGRVLLPNSSWSSQCFSFFSQPTGRTKASIRVAFQCSLCTFLSGTGMKEQIKRGKPWSGETVLLRGSLPGDASRCGCPGGEEGGEAGAQPEAAGVPRVLWAPPPAPPARPAPPAAGTCASSPELSASSSPESGASRSSTEKDTCSLLIATGVRSPVNDFDTKFCRFSIFSLFNKNPSELNFLCSCVSFVQQKRFSLEIWNCLSPPHKPWSLLFGY